MVSVCKTWSLPSDYISGLCSSKYDPPPGQNTCPVCAMPSFPNAPCVAGTACSGAGLRMPFYVNIVLDEPLVEPFANGEVHGVYQHVIDGAYDRKDTGYFKSISAAEISQRTMLTSVGYNPVAGIQQSNSCLWENRKAWRRWYRRDSISHNWETGLSYAIGIGDYLNGDAGYIDGTYTDCGNPGTVGTPGFTPPSIECGFNRYYGDWTLELSLTKATLYLRRRWALYYHYLRTFPSSAVGDQYGWVGNSDSVASKAPGFTSSVLGPDYIGEFFDSFGDAVGIWELENPCATANRNTWRMTKIYDLHDTAPDYTISNLPDVLRVRIGAV